MYSLRAIENIQDVLLLIRLPPIQITIIPPEIYMHNMMQYKTTNLSENIFMICKYQLKNFPSHLVHYSCISPGDYSRWRRVVSRSRHPVQDLESCHISGIGPGLECLNQNGGTKCFDPEPGQEDCQGDPD